MLRGIADGIKSLTSGVLKLILTLFTAYLAIAGGVSGNVDRMTLKTAKLAVSGAVPVVGGVISDATETMLSGAALLRGSIGIFGMLCVAAICFVPFVRAGASYLCYKAGAAVTLAAVLGRHEAVPRKRRHRLRSAARHAEHLLYDFIPRTRVYGGDGETNMTELLQTILLRVTIVASRVRRWRCKLAGGGALARGCAGQPPVCSCCWRCCSRWPDCTLLSWNWQGSVSQERHRRNAGAQHADHDEHGRGEHCEGGAAACGGSRYSTCTVNVDDGK